MTDPPVAVEGQRVVGGPDKVRNELRWQLQLPDGAPAVLCQLVREAAREQSLRRRYVFEAERLAALDVPCVARVLAVGPQPDPRDPAAPPPWRLRADPQGTTLAQWLTKRAPVPVEEGIEMVARLADALHLVHQHGVVLRDLEPRSVIIGDDGALHLTDFGLARMDILSSHTASSVILESSAYAAPEHLRQTTIDPRADVYTLGVVLWHALTGTLPFGDGPGLLRERTELPAISALCDGAMAGLDELMNSVLADDPDERPASARALSAMLRGETPGAERSLARIRCQACLTPMRPGLRLCLSCGKQAVQFRRAEDDPKSLAIELRVAKEDEEFDRKLREHLDVIAEETPDNLNFIIGDGRMYSKAERKNKIALPAVLFDNLEPATANALARRLKSDGFKVRLRQTRYADKIARRGRRYQLVGAGMAVVGVGLGVVLSPWWLMLAAGGGLSALVGMAVRGTAKKLKQRRVPLAQLRAAPAALPASDPLVARLASLLSDAADDTLREQIAELALLVQRLCDHRAKLLEDSPEASSVAMITEPVEPLVDLIETQARALISIHEELDELDEGVIMRAIATSEARGESESKRAPLLEGLDRLRSLEERRSAHLHRLLEAGSLLAEVVAMGLEVADREQLGENYTKLALAALGDGRSSSP